MLTAALAVLAYTAPPALGLALYLRFMRGENALEGLAVAWGLGWIVINLLLMSLNQVLLVELSRSWILPLAILFALLAILLLIPRGTPGGRWGGLGVPPSREALHILLPLSAGPVLVVAFLFLKAILYPATGPDALFYHLYLPKVAFLTGSLPRTVSRAMVESPNAFPNLLVTQQVWVYYVSNSMSQLLSRPVVPTYSALTAVLLYVTGRRWGRAVGILALLLWTSLETPRFLAFGNLSVEIWADMPTAFYSLLSAHFLLRWMNSKEGRHAASAGIFAGGATLTKYNGLLLAAGILLLLIIMMIHWRAPSRSPSQARASGIAFLLFAALYGTITVTLFARNALLFGNPVYPFLTQYLGGINLQAEAILDLYEPPPPEIKLQQAYALLSNLLFLLFIASFRLSDSKLRFLQILGTLYVLTMLLAFQFESSFFRLIQPAMPMLAIPAGVLLRDLMEGPPSADAAVTWIAVGLAMALRASLPMMAVAAALGLLASLAYVHRRWGIGGPRSMHSSKALLLLILSVALIQPTMMSASQAKYPTPLLGPVPAALPMVDDEEVLAEAWGFNWLMWTWMNENLPEGTRVMTLEINRYYVEVEFVSPASPLLIAHYYADSLEEAVDILRAADVEYVLEVPFFRSLRETRPFWEQSPIFQNLGSQEQFELVHREGDLELYRLRT